MEKKTNMPGKKKAGMVLLASVGLVATSFAASPAGASDPVDASEGVTQWTSKGAGESGGRELPSVSASGRWVAFVGRGEGQGVWLADRQANTVKRLTTGMDFNPAVSDDGRFVAYVVYGSNRSVKVIDVAKGTSKTVSLSDSGAEASGLSDFPSISADGRYVAFQSSDKELDDDVTQPAAGGGPNRAYVRDTQANETEMVGVTNGGEASQGSAIKPDISPDGRFVAFAAEAANLLPPAPAVAAAEGEETAAAQQVYLRDRTAKTTTLVSVGTDGLPGAATSAPVYGPTVSDDGSKVAFESLAANLVAGDTNLDVDAFVRDMGAEATTRLSVDSDGNQVDLPNPVVPPEPTTTTTAPGGSGGGGDTTAPDPMVGGAAVISGDGNVVAFQSQAPLTPDDVNGTADNLVKDVYAVDFAADTFERVSVPMPGGTDATGTRTDGNTGETVPQTNGADPSIDGTGHHVSFGSNGNLTGDRPISEESDTNAVEPAVSTETGIFTRLRLGEEGWFVKAAYVDLLNRDADTNGLVFWVERLWSNGDRSAVATSLTSSNEYRTLIVRGAFLTYLERAADPSGLSFWVNRLATGTPIETIEASLLGSNEAYRRAGSTSEGFVTYAFDKVLNRAPDASGLAYWVSRLDSGTTRTGMASTLIRSTESARGRTRAIYGQLLDRAPTTPELDSGVAALSTTSTKVTLIRTLVGSDEYFTNAKAHLAD